MTYIITATPTEAQAIKEHFKLTKVSHTPYRTFKNDSMYVVVSGMGEANVRKCVRYLLAHEAITHITPVYNFGIAAAPDTYAIGESVLIQEVRYNTLSLTLDTQGSVLQTYDTPQSSLKDTLVDMEAFFIAEELRHYNLKIIKVVSDHFKPETITKEFVKQLLRNALREIDFSS